MPPLPSARPLWGRGERHSSINTMDGSPLSARPLMPPFVSGKLLQRLASSGEGCQTGGGGEPMVVEGHHGPIRDARGQAMAWQPLPPTPHPPRKKAKGSSCLLSLPNPMPLLICEEDTPLLAASPRLWGRLESSDLKDRDDGQLDEGATTAQQNLQVGPHCQ